MELSGALSTKKIAEKRPPSSKTNKGRPTTSTLFSKRVHEPAQPTHKGPGGGNGGAVPPLLWNKDNSPFELHSSPVHLATRSLSARSTNTATNTTSAYSSSSTTSLSSKRSSLSIPTKSERGSRKQPSRSVVRDSKSKGLHSSSSSSTGRKPKQSTVNGHISSQPNNDLRRENEKETPQQSLAEEGGLPPASEHVSQVEESKGLISSATVKSSGFNIAEHLQKNVDPERTDGSLSPEINQFLQDISSVVQTMSPDRSQAVEEDHSVGDKPADSSQTPPMTRHKSSRPKIAANFTRVTPEAKDNAGSNSHSPIPDSTDLDPNVAASKIQHWYRENKRKQTAQLKNLLASKRNELNQSRTEELQRIQQEIEAKEKKEAERQKRRAAKMQAARKVAIEDLKKKREEKRERAEKIAQEEMALLQASGKVKQSKTTQRRPPSSKKKEVKLKDRDKPPATEVNKVVDEFFEAGDTRQHKTEPASVAPQPDSTHSHPPGPTHQPESTYDNILKTLALLEEAPPPLAHPNKSALDDSHSHLNQSGYYLSIDNVNRLESLSTRTPSLSGMGGGVANPAMFPGTATTASGGLSDSKLQSILSYLDEMDKADQDLLSEISKTRSRPKTEALPTPRTASVAMRSNRVTERNKKKQSGGGDTKEKENVPLGTELDVATAVASDVTSTIMAQRLELDNKTKTVEMLQKALNQQRELTVYHAKEMEKEGQRRLDLQKQEYEATIQRHQCFIDQLIDDKKVLSERCEQLIQELKELDKKYKTRLKTMEESHSAELAKIKQVSAAADKLRREKWRAEETQRIKEGTVKSLEPEIQRIIAKGKAEIQKLKAIHEAELLQSDERASRRFVSQMEELRAQCAGEKEQACAHERELARQRYEKLAEQEELNYQQQRRRLFGEVQQEKEKLASQFHQQKVLLEQQQREMEEEKQRFGEELKVAHSQQLEEMQRRHSSEVREVRERVEVERQAWEENIMKRQENSLMTREREMKEQLRQERDKEIEMVIGRLEEETASSREECERAAEARVRRIREKYEAELREVERSERQTLEKFNTMKSQVVEMEGEVTRVKSLLRQKEREVEQVSQVASKLTNEKDNVADVVRQEFADRLVMTDEENKQLKIEMSEVRARHKVELERMRKNKEKEMEEVHGRVKQALTKKEENLTNLRQQYESALKRADHLEMLLERQRKELLKK